MTGLTVGILSIVVFLILLFLDVPVHVGMMICGVVFSIFLVRTPKSAITFLSEAFFSSFTSYTTSVMPMFLLMGSLAAESRLGDDLFDCFAAVIGHRRGGLASATMVACAVFGAICGSAAATTALMSRVAYPQMKKYNYKETLSCGGISAGSALSILIPPSMSLIMYGLTAEASISKLLMGGILTGVVLMIVFIIVVKIWTIIDPQVAPASRKCTGKERWHAIRQGGIIEIFIVFALSMGGMFAGWFTPTEAGVVGVAGMFIVSLIFKRFSFKVLWNAVLDTLVMSGMMYVMMVGATCFGKLFTISGIPTAIGNLAASAHLSSFGIVMMITLVYLILGCFIDSVPLVLLMTPIFLPVVEMAGFDAIWFGCYVVVVISLGSVTPPVGMACYTCAGIVREVPVTKIFKGAIPFDIGFVVMCILLALFPQIATWLPSLVMG